ncbi:MAG: hypothetical protein RBS39_00615 [Phycisphaerales bacterium]|nr:hypothetical protein [Phycisphaerales bacterium]
MSTRGLLLVLVGLVTMFATSGAIAQYRIVGGHALDSNLRVGSGGFNTRVSTRAPGLQSPVYRYDATGARRQNYTTQHYTPTRAVNRSSYQSGAITYGGSYATVGGAGLNTTGYALSSPTYNPLAAPTYVDRMPTGIPNAAPLPNSMPTGLPSMGLTSPQYTPIRRGQ